MRPQLGSPPAIAVFTRALSAIALGDCAGIVACFAAANFDRDQVRRPFAVVGNLAGQLDAQFV